MTQEQPTSKFTSAGNKGFTMGFANGLVISVQWGSMNYCERKSLNADPRADLRQEIVQSGTAEIAIWDADGTWFNFGDLVKGWCTADEVVMWMQMTAEAESIHDLYHIAREKGQIENTINLK
jgi:hypothetical protein